MAATKSSPPMTPLDTSSTKVKEPQTLGQVSLPWLLQNVASQRLLLISPEKRE
jgi:hypothetical protein